MKYNIFISYRRAGGLIYALLLEKYLREDGYFPFLDIHSMRSGQFDKQLLEHIDECDDFLLIVTPNALNRCKDEEDWMRKEITYALSKRKIIIPVLTTKKFPHLVNQNIPEEIKQIKYLQGVTDINNQFKAQYDLLKILLKAHPISNRDLLNRKIDNLPEQIKRSGDIRREGEYIFFGLYPQSIAPKEAISHLEPNGYYMGIGGTSAYVKEAAIPCGDRLEFSNDQQIVRGESYYFKVEPIKWRIIDEDKDTGTALILSEKILINTYFDTRTEENKYCNSDIRYWLNKRFITSAFSEEQRDLIIPTQVDNSEASTNPTNDSTKWNDGKNEYCGEDTQDHIFLLSEKEVTNPRYGFKSDCVIGDEKRRKNNTDYARCLGCWTSKNSSFYGNGRWWLRSPYHEYLRSARDVNERGTANDDFDRVFLNSMGVVPAMRVKLPKTIDDQSCFTTRNERAPT